MSGLYPFVNYQNMFPQMGMYQPVQQFQNLPLNQHPFQTQFFVRPVGSMEEAKGFSVDPGYVYLFTDTANKSIYQKEMGNDGLSRFSVYKKTEDSQDGLNPVNPIQQINERLSNIERLLGGQENEQYASDDATGRKESYGTNTADVAQPYAGSKSTGIQRFDGYDERQRQ